MWMWLHIVYRGVWSGCEYGCGFTGFQGWVFKDGLQPRSLLTWRQLEFQAVGHFCKVLHTHIHTQTNTPTHFYPVRKVTKGNPRNFKTLRKLERMLARGSGNVGFHEGG